MQQAHEVFQAPQLKTPEIVSCLGDIGIACTAEDLTKPTPERVREILGKLVSLVFYFNENGEGAAPAPKFSATDHIENPEYHDDAFAELLFMHNMQKLTRVSRVKFNFQKDVYQPQSKHFKHTLSQIINYLKFREERLTVIAEYTKEQVQLEEFRVAAEQSVSNLVGERAQQQAEREKEAPTVKTLEEENLQLQTQLDGLNKHQLQLKNDSHAVKQATQGVLDQAAQVRVELLNLKQENARLKAQIVPAPEKVKKMIEEMNISLENEKRHIEDLEKNAQTLRTRCEAISKLQKEVVRILSAVEECESERNKLKEVKQHTRETKAKAAVAEQKLRDLKDKEVTVKRALGAAQEKLARHARQAADKKHQALAALEEARKEKVSAENEAQSTLKAAIEQENATVKGLQQKMADAVREHEGAMTIVKEKLEQLEMQVQSYHYKLQLAMDGAPALGVR